MVDRDSGNARHCIGNLCGSYMNMERLHHEIYLSDARKVAPEKWKTVIRHPIKKL